MLEVYILSYLIRSDGRSYLSAGESQGFALAHLAVSRGVPKATLYRAIKTLITMGKIVRVSRGFYKISPEFRADCNFVKSVSEVA